MKNIFKIFCLIIISFFYVQNCNAQNNYSSSAISVYNAGVSFHNQKNYEMAEQKYIQTLHLQPNFVEAKKNLSVIYYNKSINYSNKGDYKNSIDYSQKSLSFGYNKIECYYLLAENYKKLNDYTNSALYYNKILTINPKDDSAMSSLAYLYLTTNQNEKAQELYKKILLINPNDKIAQNNLKYVSYVQKDKKLSDSLNNLKIEEKAPKKIYRLIKCEKGVPKDYKEKMKPILDLIWSEQNGRTLLTTLSKKRIPIKIRLETAKAETLHKTQIVTYSSAYGLVPVSSYTTTKTIVNIPITYINNFNDNTLTAQKRIESLTVFVHEFGHAYMLANNPYNKDSIEEEIGVSMIGYNIASKILTGEYLNREESKEHAKGCLEGALSDEHRNLPVYGDFKRNIKFFGVALPYPEEYSNLISMYKILRSEGKTTPVPNFEAYLK